MVWFTKVKKAGLGMLEYKNFSYASADHSWWQKVFIRATEFMTGQRRIYKLYRDYYADNQQTSEDFYISAIRRLDLTVNYDPTQLNAIPKTGALVVVANHPYGVLDGLIINKLIQKVRSDFKVLTNGVLCQAPEANANLLPIDFSDTEQALRTNLETRRQAREILKNGGCIVVFPAGGVSSIPTWRDKVAQDTEWQPFIGSLIQGAKADVVPIFFEGQNSRLFQFASLFSSTLRLALFFKELADKIGSHVGVVIGDTIPFSTLTHYKDKADLLHHLRSETYRIGGMDTLSPPKPAYRIEPAKRQREQK